MLRESRTRRRRSAPRRAAGRNATEAAGLPSVHGGSPRGQTSTPVGVLGHHHGLPGCLEDTRRLTPPIARSTPLAHSAADRLCWIPVSYVASSSMSAPSNALPRLRTLCTNSNKPRYRWSFSWEMPQCRRSQLRKRVAYVQTLDPLSRSEPRDLYGADPCPGDRRNAPQGGPPRLDARRGAGLSPRHQKVLRWVIGGVPLSWRGTSQAARRVTALYRSRYCTNAGTDAGPADARPQ
jgi:hypothetical protein